MNLTRRERRAPVLLVLAASALLLGWLARPLAVAASSDLAAWLVSPLGDDHRMTGVAFERSVRRTNAVLHEDLTDPWGRPWRIERAGTSPRGPVMVRVYSVGPDGRDDDGANDDVVLRTRPGVAILRWSPLLGVAVACLLVWCWLAVRAFVAPRAGHVGVEVWRAVQVASLPAALTAGVIFWGEVSFAALGEVTGAQRVFVPVPVAVSATLTFLLWLAALRLRLRHARDDASPAPAPIAPARVRTALVVAAALVAAVGTVGWGLRERAAVERRAVLGLACTRDHGVREVLDRGDPELLRAYVRGAPAWADFTLLDDASYRALAALGPDANHVMVRALADPPDGVVRRGQPSTPWRHVRLHDERLETLMTAVAARPAAYKGLLLDQAALVASRIGRRAVAGALLELLTDSSGMGFAVNGYELRMCDRALEALVALFPGEPTLLTPAWDEQTPERWDATVAAARAWGAAGVAASGQSVPYVVLDVRGLTLDARGRSSFEARCEGLVWSGGSDEPQRLVARVMQDARPLQLVEPGTGRRLEVPLSIGPGQAAWVLVDVAAGTVSMTTHTPPP